MKGFIKGLKELQQAGKKLVDEGKAIKAKELAEEKARLAKELAERMKQLKEEDRKEKEKERKEKELETKIANVLTFSSSNVEISLNFGMVFDQTVIEDYVYVRDSIEILEKEVLYELKRQTFKRGGDAIINLRFDFTVRERNTGSNQILLTGYGDAVRLRK